MTHSYGERTADNPNGLCGVCLGDHGGRGPCDHQTYSRKLLRFVRAHQEAYTTAYTNPDKRTSRAELDRLAAEKRTLPPRHDCSCWPTHCRACLKLAQQRTQDASAVEIGHTAAINAPLPSTLMLDVYAGYAR